MNTPVDTEKSVLGFLLLTQGKDLMTLETTIRPSDMGEPKHQAIYAWMLSQHGGNGPISVDAMCATLVAGDLRKMGGADYLWSLGDNACTSDLLGGYVDIIVEAARRRRIVALAERARSAALGGEASVDTLNDLERGLLVVSGEASSNTVLDMAATVRKARERIAKARSGDLSDDYVSTGFPSLDDAYLGWARGWPTWVGGIGKMGKTTLLCASVLRGAMNGVRQGVISLEMSDVQLAYRMATTLSGVPYRKAMSPHTSVQDLDDYRWAMNELSKLPIVTDCESRTLSAVCGAIRRMARVEKTQVIYLDYSQLIAVEAKSGRTRSNDLDLVCDELRNVCKAENVALVIFAQFNEEAATGRKIRGRRGVPARTDWRNSKKPLYDGFLCLGVYREFFWHPPKKPMGSLYDEEELSSMLQPIELVCLAARNAAPRHVELWVQLDVHQVHDPMDDGFNAPVYQGRPGQ